MIKRILIASVISIIYICVLILAAYVEGWIFVDETKPLPESISLDEMRVFYGVITLSILWVFATCIEVIVKIFKAIL